MLLPDVIVAGAGLIGLSCALELRAAGLSVLLLERGEAGRESSWAAAGMLATHDPANPVALRPLAELSRSLYPAFLEIVEARGGIAVPIETEWTLEQEEGWQHHRAALPGLEGEGYLRIAEQSLDPRKLVAALREAVVRAGVTLEEHTPVRGAAESPTGVTVRTAGESIEGGHFVDCTGAWSALPVRPAKGQMLRVHAPSALAARGGLGNVVVRTPDVYLVPRLDGSLLIGATVEDAGFDRAVDDAAMAGLRARAAAILPPLAGAPEVERWAGLRPDTPDHLPILGSVAADGGGRSFLAVGHFRNGVLLAPATAHLLAQLILREEPVIDLKPFRPHRFA